MSIWLHIPLSITIVFQQWQRAGTERHTPLRCRFTFSIQRNLVTMRLAKYIATLTITSLHHNLITRCILLLKVAVQNQKKAKQICQFRNCAWEWHQLLKFENLKGSTSLSKMASPRGAAFDPALPCHKSTTFNAIQNTNCGAPSQLIGSPKAWCEWLDWGCGPHHGWWTRSIKWHVMKLCT